LSWESFSAASAHWSTSLRNRLDLFHSSAVKLPELRASWTAIVLTLLKPFLFTVNGRIVLLAVGYPRLGTGGDFLLVIPHDLGMTLQFFRMCIRR
jgi:hypothetical protein